MMHTKQTARGVTLVEIMVVLSILVAIAALTVPRYEGFTRQAQITTTQVTLRQLQDLIVNRYVVDMAGVVASTNAAVAGGLPGPHANSLQPATRSQSPQLAFLFINPVTNDISNAFNPIYSRGWRGPYLLSGRGGDYPGADPSTAVARGFGSQFGVSAAQSTTGVADQAVLDVWGNPIVMRLDADFISATAPPYAFYELVSAGPDGTLNTSDDLSMPLR